MLNVFYVPAQCAPQSSYSPSSIKPQYVVRDWERRFGGQINVCGFEPVGRAAFKRVHDSEMVDAVLDRRAANGFGNRSLAVANSLPYTAGSLVAAAEFAVLHKTQTCSPTSGFHHATFDSPQGYCTFNGLMVTAMLLRDAGLVHSVGVIDCDAHYGNGTDDIIRRLNLDWVCHHTMGAHFHSQRDVAASSSGASAYARWLQRAIDDVRGCDLVIYQAGADPHINDPLGGVLTTQQMVERDRMVFEGLRGRPLVWNLAGGYQTTSSVTGSDADAEAARLEPVLALHRNTIQVHLEVLGASGVINGSLDEPSSVHSHV
jgi:acetoin utilization deacetylase AcuC-like enzyme